MRIHRHIGFWNMAASNILRHKGRSAALVMPLMIVVACFGVITFMKDGLIRDAELSMSFVPDLTVQQTLGGRIDRLQVEILSKIQNLPHVQRASPRVWGYLPYHLKGAIAAFTLMGIDWEKSEVLDKGRMIIQEGRFFEKGDKNRCVIGNALAKSLNVRVGDSIELSDNLGNKDQFQIIGLFDISVQIYAADLLLTDLDSARKFFGYGSQEASDLCVYLDDAGYRGQVAEKISSLSPSLRILSKDALLNSTRQAYGGRGGVFQLMWLILLLTSCLIAWSQASHINLERAREIGIFKALGWEIMDVIELNLIETTILGIMAAILGVILALGYILIDAPGIKSYFLGWATIYPEFPIPILVSLKSICLVFAICLAPLWMATVIPAWLLGIIEPDAAIRR